MVTIFPLREHFKNSCCSVSQKSVNRDLQIERPPSVFLILQTGAEVQASRQSWCRWSEPYTGRNHPGHTASFDKFCFRVSIVLYFCIGHGLSGAIVNFVCESKQNKNTWDLLMLIPCWVRESQGEVSTHVCVQPVAG